MMTLNKEEKELIKDEILLKFKYGMDYKKYQDQADGMEIWRRGYLRRFESDTPSYQRSEEQKYFLGLMFRSVEQFSSDVIDSIFSNNPSFVIRPKGLGDKLQTMAQAVQAVLGDMVMEQMPYDLKFMQALRHVAIGGVAYIVPFYNFRQMKDTNLTQRVNLQGEIEMSMEDKLIAVNDHPDFDVVYPTRVVMDPATKVAQVNSTARWGIIERQRPLEWYLHRQMEYGFSDKVKRDLRAIATDASMETSGPNNLDREYSLNSSKTVNELEYVGHLTSLKRFDPQRLYRVTLINQELIIRADVNTAPGGIGIEVLNLLPDIDGSHIGIGLCDPLTDYQRGTNEWYNLRMRGLAMSINPAYIVDTNAIPEWEKLYNHPPGEIFPTNGSYDAKRVLQTLTPPDTAGHTYEQMMSFTQQDAALTSGQSNSRFGSIEDVRRSATELTQVEKGADKRTNNMMRMIIRTGHKPTLKSMLQWTLRRWSTPRVLRLVDEESFRKSAVEISPEDLRGAEVDLEIIDASEGSMDQQMIFFEKIYHMALVDPQIDRNAALLAMLRNSKLVKDPTEFLNVNPEMLSSENQEFATGQEAGRIGQEIFS